MVVSLVLTHFLIADEPLERHITILGSIAMTVTLQIFFMKFTCKNWVGAFKAAGSAYRDVQAELFGILKDWEQLAEMPPQDLQPCLAKVQTMYDKSRIFTVTQNVTHFGNEALGKIISILWVLFGGHMVIKKSIRLGDFMAILDVARTFNKLLGNLSHQVHVITLANTLLELVSTLTHCDEPWRPLGPDSIRTILETATQPTTVGVLAAGVSLTSCGDGDCDHEVEFDV